MRVEFGLPNISTLGSQRKFYSLDRAAAILRIKPYRLTFAVRSL